VYKRDLAHALEKVRRMIASAGVSDSPEPFVSVVTVSLNAIDTIEDTIASVALQKVGFRVEHVCVDGGSTDGTRELIDRWAATANILRVYERDTGIYDAMNKGLRVARGEYVLYLNADDFLVSETTLARALGGLESGSHGNPDLVLGDVAMGEPGRPGFWRRRRVPRILSSLPGIGFFPLHQGMFAKRSLLNAIGGFDTRQRLAADVNQYYDLERRFKPTKRFFDDDVSFMRAGGAANAGPRAIYLGSKEIFRHLRPTYGALRAACMLTAKTLQSVSELRYGIPPHRRWFDVDLRENRKSA